MVRFLTNFTQLVPDFYIYLYIFLRWTFQSFSEGLKHKQFKQPKSFPQGVSQRAIIFPTQKNLNLPKTNSVIGDAQVKTFSELIKKQRHG